MLNEKQFTSHLLYKHCGTFVNLLYLPKLFPLVSLNGYLSSYKALKWAPSDWFLTSNWLKNLVLAWERERSREPSWILSTYADTLLTIASSLPPHPCVPNLTKCPSISMFDLRTVSSDYHISMSYKQVLDFSESFHWLLDLHHKPFHSQDYTCIYQIKHVLIKPTK